MEALEVAMQYFEAWNRRDPEAIAAILVPDGTYTDPSVPQGLGPAAAGEYARGLFAGFPDLAFEIVSATECGAGTVAAQWVMTGTNDGSFLGLPPSGRAVRLPGADFIATEDDRVRSVVGYFDTRVVPEQLGLQVIVQPVAVGPFSFGTSTYVSRSGAEPGAVSLTVLEARSDEERQEVADRSRDTVLECWRGPASSAGWACARATACSRSPRGRTSTVRRTCGRARPTRRRWSASSPAPGWREAVRPACGRPIG